jgi:hypothetical protein
MEPKEIEANPGRKELIELYSHFRSVGKEELNLLYQYLNFYVGLLSAILAATLAGILNSQNLAGSLRELYLLVGPLLILALSIVGNSTVNVFYHRFVQAWVATTNIEAMLQLSSSGPFCANVAAAPYPSKYGSFIPQVESPAIKQVFDQGKIESWSAEEVVRGLVKIGITRRNARTTFISFGTAGCLVAFAIVADIIWL